MSKPVAKPHVVKVYGAAEDGLGNKVFRMLERVERPSKTQAERYAHEARQRPEVTSAAVEPL